MTLAEQIAAVPPFNPEQVQFHVCPVSATLEAVPWLQRFDIGAVKKFFPLAEPHAPSTSRLAEQREVVPPLALAQVQFHGPVPVTSEAVPALQRPAVGSEMNIRPMLLPQAPFTMRFAEQFAEDPPLNPEQVQFHGPVPVIAEVVPELQRPVVGVEVNVCPLLLPQTPFTFRLAEQFAVAPPFDPWQVQLHGLVPVTTEAAPALQRPVVGFEVSVCPLLLPHAPSTLRFAEQFVEDPPVNPLQVQFHGPVPVIAEAVPTLQRSLVGAEVKFLPLLLPQAPLTGPAHPS